MNGVSVVIVGIDHWKDWTEPLLWSIAKNEVDCEIVLVDNGSTDPYVSFPSVRLDKKTSYAAALNAGIRRASGDWLVLLNNDVLCTGPFTQLFRALDKACVYAQKTHEREGFTWVDGWFYVFHRSIWEAVGEFDEAFKYAAFEDADWSYRALKLGYPVKRIDPPFKHLKTSIRFEQPRFQEARLENWRYFLGKHGLRYTL